MFKMDMNKIFAGCFMLSEKSIVKSLESGAREYGGATKINDMIFSNHTENNEFSIYEGMENIVGIIVPGTIDVNNKIDNFKFKNAVLNMLENRLVKDCPVEGAWIMDNGDCVIENNNLLTFKSDCSPVDLELLKKIADYLKVAMSQEAISIVINDSLIIY